MHRLLSLVAWGLLVSSSAAAPAEMPIRKAGLWDMKMVMAGRPTPITMQHCTDAATDRLMTSNFGSVGQQECSKRDIQVNGSTVTIDSVCRINGVTMTTHAVASGNFNSAYTVKLTTRRDGGPPAAGAAGETNMSVEAKWTGACKGDQKPGDMIMPGGQKINITDLQDLRRGGGGAPPAGLPPGIPQRPGLPQPK
jgi:Protein of unknown function (DUF3617)